MSLPLQFYERFKALDKAFGRYDITGVTEGSEKIKGKASTINGAITVKHWEKHLSGEMGIGLVPICQDNTCTWGAIDVDKYDLDLIELSTRVDEKELPVTLCRTKSGGAHLYLFTREPVPAKLMREKLKTIELSLGFSGNEIFPKQDMIDPQHYGSWINMPYFGSDDTVRYAIVAGRKLSVEGFLKHVDDIALSRAELNSYRPHISSSTSEFEGAPPCLLYFIEHGFPDGSRNNALFSMGVFARKKYPENWKQLVHDYNQRFMGPGTYDEVTGIIKSLDKRSYGYKCKDQPLAPVCSKKECLECTFGIYDPKQEKKNRPCILENVDRPVIKVEPVPGSGDDPYYLFKIGGQTLELSPDAISNQNIFLRKYLITFNRLELAIDANRWKDAMNELLSDLIVEVMAPDAGPEGQLLTLVEAFCTGKVQARSKEELQLGKPWTSEGRTYFCSKDVFKFMAQQGFRAFRIGELYPIFRRNGMEHHSFTIKGKSVGCWSLPEFSKQTEDFDRVTFDEEEGAPF